MHEIRKQQKEKWNRKWDRFFINVHSINKWWSVPFVPGGYILWLQQQATQQDYIHGNFSVVGLRDYKQIFHSFKENKEKYFKNCQNQWFQW